MGHERAGFLGQHKLVDPNRMAQENRHIKESIELMAFSNLTSMLQSSGGEVKVEFTFSKDIEQRCLVTLQVQAELPLCCQRCFGTYLQEVDKTVIFSPVHAGFAQDTVTLPEAY